MNANNNLPGQKCGFGITCLVFACIYALCKLGTVFVCMIAARWGVRQMVLVQQGYNFVVSLLLIATIVFAMLSFWKKEKPLLGCLGLLFVSVVSLIMSVVGFISVMVHLPPE